MKHAMRITGFLLALSAGSISLADDHPPRCGSGTWVPLRDHEEGQASGVIDDYGDVDYFRFQVPATGTVTIQTAGWTDTLGYLKDSNCRTINDPLADDDRGTHYNFRITKVVTRGTYFLGVQYYAHRGWGPYDLYISFRAASDTGNSCLTARNVTVPFTWNESIAFAGDQDYYNFEVRQTSVVTLETTGSTDTFGKLMRHNCFEDEPIKQNDDGGAGTNFRISETLAPGFYSIKVRHYSPWLTGAYTLRVTVQATGDDGDSCSTATSVSSPSQTAARIERGGDVDVFRFEVRYAHQVTIETDSAIDTWGELRNSSCVTINDPRADDDRGWNRNFRIVRHLAPGTYFVAVRHYSRFSTGSYTLRVGGID